MALPKQHRLPTKYYFKRVKSLGTSFSTPYFFLNIAPSKDSSFTRFGFIISTKIDKRATVRNRIRRLLSEIIRLEILPKLEGSAYDVVFVARPAIIGKDYEEIAYWVNKILPKTPLAHT